MNIFKVITIDDYEILRNVVKRSKQYACDYTPANLVLWGKVYQTEYCIIDDMLILKYKNKGQVHFSFPVGGGDAKKAVEWIRDYCKKEEIPFILNKVEPEMLELFDAEFIEQYEVELDRDSFDYVYRVEDLKNLSGKKYHGKKNHINKFKKEHEIWSYETITEANKEECLKMVKQWCKENGCCDDEEKAAEICVLINGINNMERLGMKGGMIRTEEGIVAMTLGEEVNEEMFVIHFEKAFARVQGAYPMINQQFIEHELGAYEYVNREEDLGIEGLRKAKESYKPVFLVEKGIVKEKVVATQECVQLTR